jgi:hypothetical protein
VDDQENNLMVPVNVLLAVVLVVDCSIVEEQIVDIVVITSDFL